MRVYTFLTLPDFVAAAMRRRFDLVAAPPGDALGDLLRRDAAAERFTALVTGVGCPLLDAATIARLPASLRIIATYSVGTDHIDLAAAAARGIAVANTPDALTDSVADAALLLILAAARRAIESVALLRSGSWAGWQPDQLLGLELRGRVLGVYGYGAIGRATADRARACGMRIAYTSRWPVADADAWFVADPLDLVAQADVLLLAAPSTAETRGFVNAATLARARPSLILVNIARGDLVVDGDLIAALVERRIAAAALDVFAHEPDIDPGYFALPNLVMTPHIGSSTVAARERMGMRLIDAIAAATILKR